MSENNDQRTTHIGGNATEAIIVSGNGNVINMQQNQDSQAATPSFFDYTQDDKIADLCEFYLERPEILAEIDKQLNLNARCLLICGEPGIGKSALSAFLIRKFQKDAQYHVIYHLIGYSWKNWKKIVLSLLYQLRMKFENLNLTIPNEESEDDTVISLYREALSRISKVLEDKKLVIVIDALDESETQGESLKNKNLFQFIPSDLLWKNICFLLTSRFGDIRRRFSDYMKGKLISLEIRRMNEAELEKLADHYGVSLDKGKMMKLLNISKKKNYVTQKNESEPDTSEGNFLYITEILKKLKDDSDYDLSELPDTVVGFFRKELIEKFDITENELLKSILALIKVFQIHPSDVHFKEILGLESKEQSSKLIDRISSYLSVSNRKESSPLYPKLAGKTYSFFHSKFAESLTFGDDPLITEEDIVEAHQKIINWCEPFEKSEENTPRFQYGFEYLPYHYWTIGEYDDYKGFLDFLGRCNLNCEISCRIFLHKLITSRSEKELLEDKVFQERFKRFFIEGTDNNYAARYALLRFSQDLVGYGYNLFRKHLWDCLITNYDKGTYWYNEIFNETVDFQKRLEVAKQIILSSENVLSFHKFIYYHSIGNRLCYPEYSREIFEPIEGLKKLEKAKKIANEFKIEDFFTSACQDKHYAEYRIHY